MAQLELSVVLNLANFRTQLGKLAQASAAYYYPINLTIDQKAFRKQLAAIGNIKTTLRINTNLEAEIQAADRLAKALQRVQQVAGQAKGNLPLGTKGLSRTTGQGGFSAAQIKTLFNASIQGGLLDDKTLGKTRAQMVAALGAIGRDSIKGLLDGLESSDAQLQQAAQTLGKSLIASFKDVLGIASPSKEFKKIGDDAGKGFEQGLLRAMEIAEQSATRQMQRMLDRLARMALMMGGMSASQISQQVRGMRALSPFDWQATTPSRSGAIGPSSTGRMLPPGYERPGLPGTVIGSQKLLMGDILDPSLKNAAREAANAFVDTIRRSLNEAIRSVSVRDLGNALRPALAGSRVAGFLAPGVGRVSNPYGTGRLGRDGESRAELFARREREARMRSALRGVDVMGEGGMAGRPPSSYSYAYRAARPQGAIVPYAPGGAMVYSGPGGGGLPPGGGTGGGPGNFAGRGGGSGGGFNMPKLPGAGLVREIGQEFAFATKQVLLFGTAYKALAFATNFPAQVGQAVAALQSFNNTLKAVSPNAKEVEASNKLILQLVDKYNIPLQSARDGFTKLYASMQSAGFGGNEVRDIFTGISKAAATFGMSADKVDRVNYAFAQMASKGQVMSEELKGQLGDVLPGALGIFAEAAGFKGPDAIQKFSAALEDGAYKGQAMKQLLTNVGIVMNKEFGPGAEGAARTFQGAMNRMQNSMKLLYESFEPVAVGFLNTVVMPMTSGIKTVTDGFNAFFTGQAAQTAGGSALAQQLNELKPSFEGILSNIKELVPTFQLLGNILIGVAKAFTVIIGNPIIGFLAKLYANVLLINGIFTLLGGKVLVSLIGSIGAAVSRFVALNVAVATTQKTATVANSTLAGTQLQMALLQKSAGMATGPIILLRNALLSLANMGLIAIGINVVINGLAELDRLKRSLAEIGTFSSAKYRKEVSGMSKEDINSRLIENKRTQQAIEKELRRYTGPLGAAEGLTTGRDEELRARLLMVQTKEQELIRANKTAKAGISLDSQVTGGITPVGTGTGGSQKTKGKGKDRESQVAQLALELEYAKELSALEAQIFNAQLGENNLLAVRLEGEKELLDLRYEKLKVDLEDIPPEEKKLKIQTISQKADLARIKTRSAMEAEITKAINEQQRAVESLQAASQLELDNKKQYQELLKNGVAPEQAKILIEVDNEIKKIREALELTRKRVKAEIDILEALKAQGKTIDEALLNRLKGQYGEAGQGIEALPGIATEETAKRFALNMPKTPTEYVAEGLDQARKNLAELANTGSQGVNAANAIGDAFGNAFKGIIDGSMTAREALAGMFQSIADHFADMVAQMIAEWIKMMVLKGIEAIINPMAGLASLGGGGGGLSSGFSAGTASAIPTDAAGWGAAFSTPLKFATGGIAPGGFTAFANGGMVTGPTMGLVGEGRYNEAIVPLPNGKSIPVELGGASQGNVNVVVNVDAKGSQVEGNEAQSKQLGRVVSAAVQAEIVKQQRPGGLLSSSRSF